MTQIPPTDNKKRPTPLDQKSMDALYKVFQAFALEDQRKYYQSSVRRYRKAADQVNHFRAIFALIAGLASAAAGLIVGVSATEANCRLDFVSASTTTTQVAPALTAEPGSVIVNAPPPAAASTPSWCFNTRALVFALVIAAIVAPAIAAGFGTLSDIYQWDRLINVYDTALENLEVADAQSPLPEMDELIFRASLRAYAEGTLAVMRDETAQWGQLPKPPERLETFIAEERRKAAEVQGSADDLNVDAKPPQPPVLPA